MSGIRGKDTKPELYVRSALHRAGLRFRLQAKLPGRPDIVLAKYKAAVFVHGCFWHRHARCRFSTTPSSNATFWLNKFESNTLRDKRAKRQLRRLGWTVTVVWSCQLNPRRMTELARSIREQTHGARE